MTGRQRPSRFRLLATPAAALLAGCVLSVACTAARAAYEVRIEAPRPLRDLLERHLDLARYQDRKDITDDQLQYMVETIGEQVTKLTATEGYFVPKATAQLEGPPERRTVRVKVEAGPRTTIDSVALDFTGAIAQEPKRIDALKKAWGLPQGAPFRQSGWDKAKEDSLAALQSKRYYAARQTASQARVDPDENKADLSVAYDSGPAYTLGPLDVQGLSRYPRSIIDHVNPLIVGGTIRPTGCRRWPRPSRASRISPTRSSTWATIRTIRSRRQCACGCANIRPTASPAGSVTAPIPARRWKGATSI